MTVYIKTTWNSGDVITATRMSNLETQYDDVALLGTLTGVSLTSPAISIASNVLTLDASLGNVKSFTFNANITSTPLSNIPASGKFFQFTFVITANGSSFTWAWLTGTVKWPSATPPIFTTTNAKVDTFAAWTIDGGTTWYGIVIGQNM